MKTLLALLLALVLLPGCYAINRVAGRDTTHATNVDGLIVAGGVGLAADSVMRSDSPNEYLVGWSIGMTVLVADIVVAVATGDK